METQKEIHEIRVRFAFAKSGTCEDVYISPDTKRYYIRQVDTPDDYVKWYTCTNEFEALGCLKSGIHVSVLDDAGVILFEEVLEDDPDIGFGTRAKCEGPFSWEAIQEMCESIQDRYHLHSYEDWRDWLLDGQDREAVDIDEWLYVLTDCEPKAKIVKVSYLGKPAYLLDQKGKHQVTGQKWTRYALFDTTITTCLGICGYEF